MKRVSIRSQLLLSFLFFTSSLLSAGEFQQDYNQESVHVIKGLEDTLHIDSYALNMIGAIVLEEVKKGDSPYKFSQDVLNFSRKVVENHKDFTVAELAKVVPELTIYFKQISEMARAPRPDAPGNTDGSPVGTLIECNLTPVLQLLNRLIQIVTQCCAILQQDFQFTWTILADIKSTITTDFNGTFTVLADIKSTITTDFNGTFTVLNDINDTLTTCCANIQTDFNGVFTVLTDINSTITNDFNGTFTVLNDINDTLTTCCANIQTDFNGVFTVLADITVTITNDFNGTFTVLDEINTTLTSCCANIQGDFNDTWTILADIKATITTDFNGTFTALAALVMGACDLAGIYTTLSDIETTLTTCCATIQGDFSDTWTILADIKSTITTDFNGTFTAIAAIISGTCDLRGIYTTLADIEATLTTCCATIQGDFSDTWTILSDIKSTITTDFNGTFTAIAAITPCDLSGIFTALSDIETTLTTCCATIQDDFSNTWTILADINATITTDFNGTFTAIAAIDLSGIYTTLADIDATLTTCCANIQINFEGTFTVLDSLKTLTSVALCAATPISTPTVITEPGFYCLATDIVGSVSIITSNVTLDLNNHTISNISGTAVQISDAQNVLVFNGRLETSLIGVGIDTGSKEVTISNVLFTRCFDEGVNVLSGCNSIRIFDAVIDTTNIGIQFENSTDVECIRITITNINSMGISGVVTDGLFVDCQVIDSIVFFSGVTSIGFNLIEGGVNNQMIRCTVKGLSVFVTALVEATSLAASPTSFIGFAVATDNTSLSDCNVQGLLVNSPTIEAEFFYITADNIVLDNCVVNGINGFGVFFAGFLVQTSSFVTLNDCLVQDLQMGSTTGFGYFFEQDSVNITANNCKASGCIADGFYLNDATVTLATLINCESNGNTLNGFNLFGGTNNLVGNCTAFQNGDAGFRSASTFQNIYGCFAANNAILNYVNIPNTQSASTATGVFARGNNFLP